ncbi:hypothetical protein G5C51_37395, partial [Streptomyces sp. A7024]|nr:hypothetical protein [Streptomyces coryli]
LEGTPPPGGVPSSNTLTGGVPGSGMPQAPSPYAQEASDSQGFMPPPTPPSGPSASVSTSPAAAPKAKRSPAEMKKTLILAGGGVLGLLAVAYGAGLVLGQDDVPKGTTVLGVDIGGSTRDEAVSKLDDALGKRVNAPLQVTVGETKKSIKPQHAGLGVDTAETVRSASGADYNPVTVIGSLFGGTREVEPKMTDDTEKLRSALEDLKEDTGAGGSERGMIKFVAGKAVPVKGSSGQSLDVDKSMTELQDAFADRAAGGPNSPVSLPTAKQSGAVTQAQFKTALDGFAKTAMSGLVTVKAGSASIQFSPEKSLPKFLTMVPDEKGNLQPHYNLKVLKQLYGTTFDGVKLKRATGTVPVQAKDVAQALDGALRATDPAERVGVIQGSGG